MQNITNVVSLINQSYIFNLKDETSLLLSYQHQRLSVKEGNGYMLIPIQQIIFIAADSNYSTLYLANGKNIMTSKTLKV